MVFQVKKAKSYGQTFKKWPQSSYTDKDSHGYLAIASLVDSEGFN